MKKVLVNLLLMVSMFHQRASAQEISGNRTPVASENYGHTLNLGVGIGYYNYIGNVTPVLHADYEFDVARNFTLAPFISFYSYSNSYYWGSAANPPRYYYYYQTVIPIGLKGMYYFDQLLRANSKWDFYLGASMGFDIISSHWENGYNGDRDYFRGASPLFLDLHAGAEYHINNRMGAFLDLSTGVSTIGLSFHRK